MIGTLLNQYRLDEVVGQGGMGVVYRAHDLNLERTVAVKVLGAACREDSDFIARFRQEARIQAGLNHPNIATLFDFFVWNDMPVAVIEFIAGESLRSLVDRSGPIPVHLALPMIVQALRGVAAGHKRGIIHRDLKPSNLMMTAEGIVKITDFGIAKVRSETDLARVSTRIGSTSYMAPEQILGRPVDEKTDIYVIGGTLYELLTGRPPFQGLSQFEIDSAHVREPPTVPTEFCPDIPPGVVDAVMRALAKEPAERFGSADEFIQALPDLGGVPYVAPVIDSTPVPQLSSAKVVHARRAVISFVASGLLALAVAGVLVFMARPAHVRTEHAATVTDLTGTWTGTYVDSSGKELLRLQKLQLQQLSNGDITGGFGYNAGGSTGDECTLEKSSYSAQSKRLRLITHCHNPDHPKYLNVPLEFNNVAMDANTIGGGRLAFHLADDVVVTLERANGT